MSWILGLHLISAHWPGCYPMGEGCIPYEKATPGIYVQAPSGLTLGAYSNSYGRGSVYAGWSFETQDRRFSLLVAGATGYKRAPVTLLVAPSVKLGPVRLAFMPRIGSSAGVAHLALEQEW